MSCGWCDKPRSTHRRIGRYSVCPEAPGPGKLYIMGVEDERAAIVAFVRNLTPNAESGSDAAVQALRDWETAEAIESGARLKDQP